MWNPDLERDVISRNGYSPDTWFSWGPPIPATGTAAEPMARICPTCGALVVNESGMLRRHLDWHR